jgi:benzoate-CoA ligase
LGLFAHQHAWHLASALGAGYDARVNLADILLNAGLPQEPALLEPARQWSYGQLDDVAGRVGGALWELGVRPGERVAVLMPDGLEAVATILGALRIGAVAVPVSELGRALDVREILRDASPIVAVVHASLEPVLDEIRREAPSLLEVIAVGGARGSERDFAQIIGAARRAPLADTREDTPAFILYSAGAHDRAPRGVVHTHGGPLAAFRAYAQGLLSLGKDDRVFSTGKLATSHGLGAGLVFPLAAGASTVLLPGQPRSADVFALLAQHQPTVFFATPSLYAQLLMDGDGKPAPLLPGVRAAVAGAEWLPAVLAARIKARCGVEVLPGFGLTEAFHFVLASGEGGVRPGSAGLPVPGVEARVVDDEGKPLPPLEIGTLEVKVPWAGRRYWNRPEESSATFRGDWLHTSDRFLVDADGWYFHSGRADDLFKVGGKWVAPDEVEQALLRHPAVWECAVIGIEDENGLTKSLAFVVPNVGHAPSRELEHELIDYVKKELAPYKYPRWIDFVDSIPRGSSGKALRYKLTPRKRARKGTIPPVQP